MLLFNARLNEKADKIEVTKSVETALERYHRLFVAEFKAEMLRMHDDNRRRLERIEQNTSPK